MDLLWFFPLTVGFLIGAHPIVGVALAITATLALYSVSGLRRGAHLWRHRWKLSLRERRHRMRAVLLGGLVFSALTALQLTLSAQPAALYLLSLFGVVALCILAAARSDIGGRPLQRG